MRTYLIGIDDTDNLESRGTGFLSRSMGDAITSSGLGVTGAITRHQLLFDPRVPYTSHNSSACLEVKSDQPNELWLFMVDFLVKSCAVGSDCGLCMIEPEKVSQRIIDWGLAAKVELVDKVMALELAKTENIQLIGLTGTHDGVIGAMAGVGLRASGNDGRFISLKGHDVRSLSGIKSIKELKKLVEVHRVITTEGEDVDDETHIDVDGWMRPVLKDGLVTVLINKTKKNEQFHFELANKEYIKSISN